MINWGVFNSHKTELHLEDPVGYIAITGETGSGKSLFIEALSYLCGYTKSSKFCDHGYIHLTLMNHSSEMSIRRTYNVTSKKSMYECNGKRVTLKEIQQYLRSIIRFWTSNDIQKLDDLVRYIDFYLGEEQLLRLDALETVYEEWKHVYEKLERLREIESRGEFDSSSSETKQLVNEIRKLGFDIRDLLRDIETVLNDADPKTISTDSQTSEVLSLISTALGNQKLEKRTTFSDSWEALLASDILLRKLSQAIDGLRAASKSAVSSIGDAPEVSRSGLRIIEKKLNSFGSGIVDVETQLRKLGWLPQLGSEGLEKMHFATEEAIRQVKIIQNHLSVISKSLPDLSRMVSDISDIRSRWELLSKRLSISPLDFDVALHKLESGLNDMENFSELLPEVIAQEVALRRKYLSGASEISKYRHISAQNLTRKVNELLPSLEVNKRIYIRHQALTNVFESIQEGPLLQYTPYHYSISASGWDSMTLICESDKSDHLDEGYVSFEVDSAASSKVILNGDPRALSSLSSGEQARLALAFEALSSGHQSGKIEALLILDEIDAHVGGEAAVAVAKLMKQLGKQRQVVAVTHNPLLAAAADVHLVVNKVRSPTIASNLSKRAKFPDSSVIARLNDRLKKESELSRMATGNLGIHASVDLAKALLSVDFGSRRS